jgi:hypothetical protein
VLQILPTGAGRCVLRHHGYTWCKAEAPAMAAQYLAGRLSAMMRTADGRTATGRAASGSAADGRASGLRVAESIQRGMVHLGHQPSPIRSAAVSAFHQQLLAMLPVMGGERPWG